MSEHINNQARRKEALKSVIRQLHEGRSVAEVKDEFAALLQDVGVSEVAEIEQALIDEGLPEMEVKRLCDVHVAVFRESLEEQHKPDAIPGHPVHTFQAENDAVLRVLDALRGTLAALKAGLSPERWERARESLEELVQYDKHYLRKENVLFPYLERHGLAGPTAVMWAIHDDVRVGWKALDELLSRDPGDAVETLAAQIEQVFKPLDTAIREMIYKEEHILYPMALETLSREEWLDIRAQGSEVGYCYVEPGDQWPLGMASPSVAEPGEGRRTAGDLLHLDTGILTPQEVNWLLTHLPVDVTYVDQDDRVRFFSQTKERIFPRSPAIIGRQVQKCHPPSSVDRVQRILDDFRAGRRDEAEFWIQMQGRFIHIRYFAVRDERGGYRGTLEVSQDVTPIRALEGERRLLDD